MTRPKRRSSDSSLSEELDAPTLDEVVDRTLSSLRNLGNQRFALSPFNAYFARWLMNLGDVLSKFESNPAVRVDEQFTKERAQIISNVEHALEDKRNEESSRAEALQSLSNARVLLEQLERRHATQLTEIHEWRASEIARLSRNVDLLQEERDRIARTRRSIFRGLYKNVRAQTIAETSRKLNIAQSALTAAIQSFSAEEQKCQDDYESEKQNLIERIRDHQREIENYEIDGSLEIRQTACETLISAVTALLQRS